MRTICIGIALGLGLGSPLGGQENPDGSVTVPLEVEAGRLVVTAVDGTGAEYRLVVGLTMSLITESASVRLGKAPGSLTLGEIPVGPPGDVQTVPDDYVGGFDGILGGTALNGHDVLIDAPGGRLVLKPVGRRVRWSDVSLSNPVRLQVFHEVLLRADVDFGGHLVGGLIDLASPEFVVNEPLAGAVVDGRVSRFRVGYGSWSDVAARVEDNQTLRGWDRNNEGFVIVGAPLAYDCVLAISWAHAELRTCLP